MLIILTTKIYLTYLKLVIGAKHHKLWFSSSQKTLPQHPWSYLQYIKPTSSGPSLLIYVQGISGKQTKAVDQNREYISRKIKFEYAEKSSDIILKRNADAKCSICQCCHLDNCHHKIQSLCLNCS